MKESKMVMSKNEFVKREQAVMKSMMGDRPGVKEEFKKFNANMMNTGERAEEACRKVTAGLDKRAFPVK